MEVQNGGNEMNECDLKWKCGQRGITQIEKRRLLIVGMKDRNGVYWNEVVNGC